MIDDLVELQTIARLPDEDIDEFRRTAKELSAHGFLIRGAGKDERLYDFAIRNFGLFEAWFSCMGAELRKDEGLGVVAWRGGHENRTRLGKEETVALLVFRALYEERRNAISLTAFPSITLLDFTQRCSAVAGLSFRKTRLKELLRRFCALKLIDTVKKDETDPDGQILLYPSLAFALDQDSIQEILEALAREQAAGKEVG
jgi:hypothetical protein